MTGLGIIGTAAAYANYRSAKAEYEALKEQQEGLVAAVQTYNEKKYSGDVQNDVQKSTQEEEQFFKNFDVRQNDIPDGIQTTTILRVGNLVGDLFRTQASVVISNTSDKRYWIGKVEILCNVLGYPIVVYKLNSIMSDNKTQLALQQVTVAKWINPGETMEINLPSGISALASEDGKNMNGELRKLICDAAGKKLITSGPKISIEGAEKANIFVTYRKEGETPNDPINQYYYNKKPGVLRYCMEAFYPKD